MRVTSPESSVIKRYDGTMNFHPHLGLSPFDPQGTGAHAQLKNCVYSKRPQLFTLFRKIHDTVSYLWDHVSCQHPEREGAPYAMHLFKRSRGNTKVTTTTVKSQQFIKSFYLESQENRYLIAIIGSLKYWNDTYFEA